MALDLIIKILFSVLTGLGVGLALQNFKTSFFSYISISIWVLLSSSVWFCNWWLTGAKIGVIVALLIIMTGLTFEVNRARKERRSAALTGKVL